VGKIRTVAYGLALPVSSVVHPLFHASQLKKLVSKKVISSHIPDASIEYQVLEEILDTRMKKQGDTEITQVLIKWSLLD
jgi:hypothetical protein